MKSHARHDDSKSVLIVEESEESRAVFRTIFERLGIQLFVAAGAREGLELVRQHRPGVVVLDLEADAADDEAVCDEYDRQSRQNNSSLLILGKAKRFRQTLPQDRIVPKPYHYGPLIRKIEQLL